MDLFLVRPDYAHERFTRPMLEVPGVDSSDLVLDKLETPDEDGRLNPSARQWVETAPFFFNKNFDAEVHTSGAHGTAPEELMAFSEPLKIAIEDLDPDAFDFVPLHGAKMNGTGANQNILPMFLAHPRCEVDAINRSQVKLRITENVRPGFRNTQFRTSARVFDPDRVPPRHYFIDALTGYGVCTPAFRKAVESVTNPCWIFRPCTFSSKARSDGLGNSLLRSRKRNS